MESNQFAVIGHPIAHTMSPFIHARLFEFSGEPARYGAIDIPPDALPEKMLELRQYDGFNITIPHKQAIIPLLDSLSGKARSFGSVNTVKNENGFLTGYTTDGTGFCKALESAGAGLGGRVVILGAGGAARALAFEAALHKAEITVAAREHSLSAARRLCEDLQKEIPGAKVEYCRIDRIVGRADLLANATPAGMFPNADSCPVSEEVVQSAGCVFDAVYNPNETRLLSLARKNSIRTVGGMSMLVWQAAAAHEIWYGAQFEPDQISRLYGDAIFEMKKKFGNIILCGFMGSGKTTVGELLARKLGRVFIDIDRYIEEESGMTVQELFAKYGEAEFRGRERRAVRALSQKSGLVVATGGGTLIDPENAAVLRKNGVVVLLSAGLDVIRGRLKGDKTRPLLAGDARGEKMERLYRQRSGTYRDVSDFIIPANGSTDEVTKEIIDTLKRPLTL